MLHEPSGVKLWYGWGWGESSAWGDWGLVEDWRWSEGGGREGRDAEEVKRRKVMRLRLNRLYNEGCCDV